MPVGSLPNEILVLVFRSVINAHSLGFEKLVDENILPVNSLAISQVCVQWRHAALGSQALWTHIDLSVRAEVVLLGEIFASRSGDLSLSIRIVEPANRWRNLSSSTYGKLVKFIKTLGPRTYSAEFATQLPLSNPVSRPWFVVLKRIIKYSSNKLTQLALTNRNLPTTEKLYGDDNYYSGNHGILHPQNSTLSPWGQSREGKRLHLHVSQEVFENVLSNIRSLKLDLIYPPWDSKAYHGLTELRLTGPCKLTAVWTTSQLATILAASPKLRILQFGLEVSLSEVQPQPVCLADLEVFLFQALNIHSQKAVLSLINPGTKPLQMSTTYDDYGERCLRVTKEYEALCEFFNRSNITHLQLYGLMLVSPQSLLPLLPNLRSLVFRETTISETYDGELATTGPRIDALHFISCTLDLGGLLWLVSGGESREITIWGSRIMGKPGCHPAEYYRDVLIGACPIIQLLDREDYERTIKTEVWGEDMKLRIARSQADGVYRVY